MAEKQAQENREVATSNSDVDPPASTNIQTSSSSASPSSVMIDIHRPAYSQYEFNKVFNHQTEEEKSCGQQASQFCSENCKCTASSLKNTVLSTFPFIGMFQMYQWKDWFLWDLIAGLSVGVIHIPQSMGFSLLTNLPPVYGLYSTFFPLIIYFFFGTSRHISVGTMAVPSIMISSVISQQLDKLPPEYLIDSGNSTENGTDFDVDGFKVDIAVSVTLIVGVFQVGMALLRLGLIATFMSMAFVGGFLTGATCIIITSQVPSMFGLKIPSYNGAFRLPKTWYAIFAHLPETNPAEVIIAAICLIFLVIIKMVINEKFKDKIKIPIPAELLVVIFGTIAAHYGEFHEMFDVRIVGDIPKGMPAPTVPSMHNAGDYILDGLIIAIVSFAISVSMAKMYSQKYRYAIDNNQEMLAYGLCQGISSFFSGFAGAQAPPRTLVHESTGGKTQLASLWSALMILLVCLFLGPLFHSLPNSVLASVIVVALLPLFVQFSYLKRTWTINNYDCIVWVVTFLSVVIIDISYGLVIGIGLSLLTVVFQAYLATGVSLDGHSQDSDFYCQRSRYQDVKSLPPGIKVFHFEFQLFFANIEKFKSQLFDQTGINPSQIIAQKQKAQPHEDKDENDNTLGQKSTDPAKNHSVVLIAVRDSKGLESQEMNDMGDSEKEHEWHGSVHNDSPPKGSIIRTVSVNGSSKNVMMETTTDPQPAVILDCSAITYCDIMGINILSQLRGDYKEIGVKFALAGCSDGMLKKLQNSGYIEPEGVSADDFIYPSVHDAVIILQQEEKIMVL